VSEVVATKPKPQAMMQCGHCNVNHHECCKSGVRNGDGSIVLCNCTHPGCRAGQPRCTECNNREQGTIGTDWRCLDKDDCAAEQERTAQKNPSYLRIRAIREAHGMDSGKSRGTDAHGRPEKPARTPRKAGESKPCTCGCGETTGGGKFKPGHDSKYLTKLVEAKGDESRALAFAISDAFGAKYDKRVAK